MNPISHQTNPVTEVLYDLIIQQKKLDAKGFRWLSTEKSFDVDKIINLLFATYGLFNKVLVQNALSDDVHRQAFLNQLKLFKVIKKTLKENKPLIQVLEHLLEKQSYYSAMDQKTFIDHQLTRYLRWTPMPVQFARRFGSYETEEIKLNIDLQEKKIQRSVVKLISMFSDESVEKKEDSISPTDCLECEMIWIRSVALISGDKYISWIELVEEWAKTNETIRSLIEPFLQSLMLRNILNPSKATNNSFFILPKVKLLPTSSLRFYLLQRTLQVLFDNLGFPIESILTNPLLIPTIEKLKSLFTTNEEARKTAQYVTYLLRKKYLKTIFQSSKDFEIYAWDLLEKFIKNSLDPLAPFLQSCTLTLIYRQYLQLSTYTLNPINLFTCFSLCSNEQRKIFRDIVNDFSTKTIKSTLISQESVQRPFKDHLKTCLELIEQLEIMKGEPSRDSLADFTEWLMYLLKLTNPCSILEIIQKVKDDENLISLSMLKEIYKIVFEHSDSEYNVDGLILTILEITQKFKFKCKTEEVYKWIKALKAIHAPYKLTELLDELQKTCRYRIDEHLIFNTTLLIGDEKISLDHLDFSRIAECINLVMRIPYHYKFKCSAFGRARVLIIDVAKKDMTTEKIHIFENALRKLSSCPDITPKQEDTYLEALSKFSNGLFTSPYEQKIRTLSQELELILTLDDWLDLIAYPSDISDLEKPYEDLIPTFKRIKKFNLPSSNLIKLCCELIEKKDIKTTNTGSMSFLEHLDFVDTVTSFIGAPLGYGIIYPILKDAPLTKLGPDVIQKVAAIRAEVMNKENQTLFCLSFQLINSIQLTVMKLQMPDMVTNDDPSILFRIANLIVLSVLSSNIQLFSDFMPVKLTKNVMTYFSDRSYGLLRRLRPVQSASMEGKGALSYWNFTNSGLYSRFTLSLFKHLNAPESRMITSKLEIPCGYLEKDTPLCIFLYDMVLDMGCEVTEARPEGWNMPESFESEYDEFMFWLSLYPPTKEKWKCYNPIDGEKKHEIGKLLFRFLKAIKISFRRAICEIATSTPPTIILEDPFQYICHGHVYEVENALSLLPPKHPKSKQAEFKVRFLEQEHIFNQIEAAMLKAVEIEFQLSTTFSINKKSTANLRVNIKVVPILHNACQFYQVTMSVGHNDRQTEYLLNYEPGLYGPPYLKLLQWQLLMLKREFYLNTFFPDF